MEWQQLVLGSNAVVCFLIVLRLMFYKKKAGSYRFSYSLLAWMVIIAAGWIAVRICYGEYSGVDPAELLLNFSFGLAVWGAGGNIAKAMSLDTEYESKKLEKGKPCDER